MRIAIYIIEVAVVVAIAVWLAERPGLVQIEWQGYRIETSVGILALAFFLFAVTVAALGKRLACRHCPTDWWRLPRVTWTRRAARHAALDRCWITRL